MSKRKIYVVGGSVGYMNWTKCELVDRMEDADLVMLTGGEDISPSLYGAKPHYTTCSNWQRDAYEVGQFKKAVELELPMISICRGAQFICAMAGGKLVQDQQHPYTHEITTNDGRKLTTNSLHHQRACLKGIEDKVELLAWAEAISPYAFGEDDDDLMDEEKECEIAFYKAPINCVSIQGHPEMIYGGRADWQVEFIDYCRELMDKYLS